MRTLSRSIAPAAVLALLLFGASVYAAGGDKTPARTTKTTISIDNFSFKERELTVTRGTEVTWVNRDDAPHKVVSVDKTTFASPVLDTDGRFSFTFTKPGTYEYFCSIHPMMTGKIVVK